MRQRGWIVGCLLVALLPAAPVGAEDPALDKATAGSLLEEAASASPVAMRALARLGAQITPEDLQDPDADMPFTMALMGLAMLDKLDKHDWQWLEHATPKDFVEALYPMTTIGGGQSKPKYMRASALRASYQRKLVVQTRKSIATGTVEFGVDKLFKGIALFTARRLADGSWQIMSIGFERSRIRVVRDGARWRLLIPKPRSTINPLRGTRLTLPRISTVGIEPPKDMTILLSVTQKGFLRLGAGKTPVSFDELAAALKQRASDPKTREQDGSCKLALLLDADASTPWIVVQWIMIACAHPAVKIDKVYMGARSTKGDVEGALAFRLPKDRSGPPPTVPPPPRGVVKAFFRPHDASDPRAVYAALRTIPLAQRQQAQWEFVTPPPYGGAVPHGSALQFLDAMLAAGASNIVFEGAARPINRTLMNDANAMASYIEKLKAVPGSAYVKIGKVVIDAQAAKREIPALGRLKRALGTPGWGKEESNVTIVWMQPGTQLQPGPAGVDLGAPDLSKPRVPAKKEAAGAVRPHKGKARLPTDLPWSTKKPAKSSAKSAPKEPSTAAPSAKPKEEAAKEAGPFTDPLNESLAWLAAHQASNGGWGAATWPLWCDGTKTAAEILPSHGVGKQAYDAGVTGLAVSAFLQAGHTNRGRHPYAKVVSRGLRYLKNVQDPQGCFGARTPQQYIYNHAAGALAMVEAYRLTGSPIFKGSAQRALDFIALSRNPYFAWRYGIKPGDNDTSVTAWMVLPIASAMRVNADAVKRGRNPPLTIDMNTIVGVTAWLDKVTDPRSGRIGYTQRGAGPSRAKALVKTFPMGRTEATTAAGLYCRLVAGHDPRTDSILKTSLARLGKRLPTWNESTGDIDMVYWYWGTRVARRVGGALWTAWSKALVNAIDAPQRRDGTHCAFRGSWNPVGAWGADGGRVAATALLCICSQMKTK